MCGRQQSICRVVYAMKGSETNPMGGILWSCADARPSGLPPWRARRAVTTCGSRLVGGCIRRALPPYPDRLSSCHPERHRREGSLGASGETILRAAPPPAPPLAGPAAPQTPRKDVRSMRFTSWSCPWRARSLRRRDADAGGWAATWPWGRRRNAVGLGSTHRHAVGASQCGRPQCNRRHGATAGSASAPRPAVSLSS